MAHRKEIQKHVELLNRDLERQKAGLQAANRELEAFSYSVSHDLRAPLRAIDGFSRVLEEEYSNRLDDEGVRLIGVVRSSTQKMGHLIDDMLSFSRTGRREMVRGKVDMNNLVKSVIKEVKQAEQGRDIRCIVHELPPAVGDGDMLRQVWTNLVSNAVKFTRQRATALIEVGAAEEDRECLYYIKDNGVGFDMRYADKLFGVFQRLHSASEFEGTGVGLAIVQRIVHRHGGRIWAGAEVGKGASFYFTLPRQRQAE